MIVPICAALVIAAVSLLPVTVTARGLVTMPPCPEMSTPTRRDAPSACDGNAKCLTVALRTGRFYGSTGPVIHDVDARDSEVVVRCTPARSVTLLTGRTSGTAVNAGRLGYSHGADVLETTPYDLVVAARLDRPETAPFARVEVVDAWGRKAWTNPL